MRRLALTGIPRGGTTLACRHLGEAADTVALFEPMQVEQLPLPRHEAVEAIETFFAATAARLLEAGHAPSKQVHGAVPDNSIGPRSADGTRTEVATLGQIQAGKPLSASFLLVVKHNAAFTALLPALGNAVATVAIVRNPLAVLASWQTVPLPVGQGRIPAAERFDPALADELRLTGDVLARQARILAWFYQRYASHLPAGRVVRYEDFVGSSGKALADAAGLPHGAPMASLQSRNASDLYRTLPVEALMGAVGGIRDAWAPWYGQEEIEALRCQLTRP